MHESPSSPLSFPEPTGGASLLLAFRAQKQQTVLILGAGLLAASRAFAALEANYSVIILTKGGVDQACTEIRWRAEHGHYKVVDWDALPSSTPVSTHQDIEKLDYLLRSDPSISLACISDTMIGTQRRTRTSAEQLCRVFRTFRIPVNTTDMPELCDFTFTSSHRFEDPSSSSCRSPLQVGVTTNGQGCRLAGRIRREIVSTLPKDVGTAAAKLGKLRNLAGAEGCSTLIVEDDGDSAEMNEDNGVTTPNQPVPLRTTQETSLESVRRRMKWVAQISEYWSISKLANMQDKDMQDILADGNLGVVDTPEDISSTTESRHALSVPKRGRILLVGSGPGHPSLLTLATYTALTKLADVVLSDKLVPDTVLALIPNRVRVRIARKFPGNAEGAQQEMMEAAVEAARQGLTVVRLKQGDPVVYGRAGEEVLYFRKHGFEPLVIPGVSSALAAPTFASIPITQRGVAESFVVCTGVGRNGKDIQFPAYNRSRTLVVLMGVARLSKVVQNLMEAETAGKAYPGNTPIAIIERASMPDQRVLMSTLENIVKALENAGEQRPPGMMVIGWSVLSLWGEGDMNVLEDPRGDNDAERISRWLDGKGWRVFEGIDSAWSEFTCTADFPN